MKTNVNWIKKISIELLAIVLIIFITCFITEKVPKQNRKTLIFVIKNTDTASLEISKPISFDSIRFNLAYLCPKLKTDSPPPSNEISQIYRYYFSIIHDLNLKK